ncbi:hypothetical protein KFE25_011191 [Diacronema lutheri]|uniref:Isochorismatase-like domain-containing protein n=1 Tax=Diacronema lutheri TaxID=2081491 RepID=A0A8J6C7Y8_DIALT|nr:hypothetical protein KFE25_011191 [Diacronema lutheri]
MRAALVIVDASVEQMRAVRYRRVETLAAIGALLDRCAASAHDTPPFELVVDSRLWIEAPEQTTLAAVYPDVGHARTPGAALAHELRASWDAIDCGRKAFDAKLQYSAFFQTRLDHLLQRARIERVYLAGMNTDYCVFATALDAFYRGYAPVILEDAVTTIGGARAHAEALKRAVAHFGAGVIARCAGVLGQHATAACGDDAPKGTAHARGNDSASAQLDSASRSASGGATERTE